MHWDRIVEEKIRAAQAEGQFDRLPGRGRPLQWVDNPFEDPAWQTANHLLKENGFRPEWIEADLELRTRWQLVRTALVRSWAWRAEQLHSLGGRMDRDASETRLWVAQEWAHAQGRFEAAVADLNRGLRRLNLLVPQARFQRPLLDATAELQQVIQPGP